jgi:hypothetical protein
MPEKTVKRRLQDCDAALASDDGPIFSTVAKLVEAIQRCDQRCPVLCIRREQLNLSGHGEPQRYFFLRRGSSLAMHWACLKSRLRLGRLA